MENKDQFNFGFKPRRPLWKDMLLFVLTVGGVWGMTHVALNYNAFAQITKYRMNQLQASVIEAFDEEIKNTEPVKLEKISPRSNQAVFKNHALRPKNQAKQTFESMPVYPSDNRLYIPRIDKNVPLVTVPTHRNWQQLEKNIQKGLQDGVVVHPISHAPGSYGNFFLTGHSSYYAWDQGRFKDVFALLHEVEEGEIVEVYWEGKKYTYQLKLKEVVLPTDTEVLNQPTNKSIITLMTCTPVGTNKKRLILTGELIEES